MRSRRFVLPRPALPLISSLALFGTACTNAQPAEPTQPPASAPGPEGQHGQQAPEAPAGPAVTAQSDLPQGSQSPSGTAAPAEPVDTLTMLTTDAGAPQPAVDAAALAPADDADSGSMSADAAPAEDLCPDGQPRGESTAGAHKLLAIKPSPEGVTVCPNGEVFVSVDDGSIMRLSSDERALEPWAELPGLQPAGITCDEHDHLFVAIYAARSGGGAAGVVRIEGEGSAATPLPAPSEASPLAAYNGILAIAGRGVYATDSGAGWVVRVHETSPGGYASEIVARNIPIANGMAYDTAKNKLYVASSLDFAVYAFDVAQDGSLSGRSKVNTSAGSFFDGVAVDEHSEVYAADYAGGTVVRLSDAEVIATLPTPASMAFRGGRLFVTDYRLNQPDAEGGLYSIELGACSGQR